MPSWDTVLAEINRRRQAGLQAQGLAVDVVRRSYLKKLAKYSKRNVIAYYSGWLIRAPNTPNLAIGDEDKNSFMSAVHKLDRANGLDLLLHTPGGDAAATESLVDYLWKMFNKDIRVIVPQLAMSAGTMIACASREIVLGKQSSLGPIDPQLRGVPAQAAIEEFQLAIQTIKAEPASTPLCQALVAKYPPAFLVACAQAMKWSKEMATTWLEGNMFANLPDGPERAARVVGHLADHNARATHARHLSMDECKGIGLNVVALEDDDTLQDLVLTVHHAFMHTFSQTPAIKIVENHLGVSTCLMSNIMQGQQVAAPPK